MTDFTHGKSAYSNHVCRCDVCRSGNAAFQRAYLAKRKAAGLCIKCGATRDGTSIVRCRACARHHSMQQTRAATARRLLAKLGQ